MMIASIVGILIALLLCLLLIEYRRRANGYTPPNDNISIYNGTFWDLLVQKIFRNLASMKYQVLLLLYTITVYGMFFASDGRTISTTAGMAFLGGGFVTLATSRIIANTSLFEGRSLNTDK